jgi:hypothetical protein
LSWLHAVYAVVPSEIDEIALGLVKKAFFNENKRIVIFEKPFNAVDIGFVAQSYGWLENKILKLKLVFFFKLFFLHLSEIIELVYLVGIVVRIFLKMLFDKLLEAYFKVQLVYCLFERQVYHNIGGERIF